MHSVSAPEMAESEKLTALKKAYAEIILNTAKESAARIMVSEKKAARYQCELYAAKDESLRMLLRLKQMLDSKVAEAEMTSLSQQRRIDELEAQLGEAEDIVKDLRGELREVQDELERVTYNHMQSFGRQNSEGYTVAEAAMFEENIVSDIATQVASLEENQVSTSGSLLEYNKLSNIATQAAPLQENQLSTSGSAMFPLTVEVQTPTLNGTYNSRKCDDEKGSHADNSFVCNADFPSIMMRSKEPELYRNGCTQRIRAFERSVLGGSLTISGEAEDLKNQMLNTKEAEHKYMHKITTSMADNLCSVGKKPDEFKVMQANGNSLLVHNFPSFRRKRKRATRYSKHRLPSLPSSPDQAVAHNILSGEDYETTGNIVQNDQEYAMAPSSTSDTSEMVKESGSVEVTKSDLEFRDSITTKPVNELEFSRLDAGCQESLESSPTKSYPETVSGLSGVLDTKESNSSEMLLDQPMADKFLKYTFQRKRKKECPSSPDVESSYENGFLKRKVGEIQSAVLQSKILNNQRPSLHSACIFAREEMTGVDLDVTRTQVT